MIKHRGGHLNWFNSRAFVLAGITAATPDPSGGAFIRRDGRLDGWVAEKANAICQGHPARRHTRAVRAGVALIARLMTAAGLTSVHEAECSPGILTSYQDAGHAGEMLFRVYVLVQGYAPIYPRSRTAGFAAASATSGCASAASSSLPTARLGADDAHEHALRRPARRLRHPDHERRRSSTTRSLTMRDRPGFQVGIHANGDVAIDMVLNAYELAQRSATRDRTGPASSTARWSSPTCSRASGKVGADPDAVLHLRLLPRRQVGAVRRREDALDVRAPFVPGLRHSGGRRLRLRPRPLRAADGDPEHGDAQGLRRPDLGREPAHHGAGPCRSARSTARMPRSRSTSKGQSRSASSPTSLSSSRIRTADPDSIKTIRVMRTVVGGAAVHDVEAYRSRSQNPS